METRQETYTINQFCNAYNISRAFFYKLRKKGKSPKIIKPFRKCLITLKAANEWCEEMQESSEYNKKEI